MYIQRYKENRNSTNRTKLEGIGKRIEILSQRLIAKKKKISFQKTEIRAFWEFYRSSRDNSLAICVEQRVTGRSNSLGRGACKVSVSEKVERMLIQRRII